MTRSRYVTPGHTAERIEKIRKLITELQQRELRADEVGNLLKLSPSGVRKYLADLRGLVEVVKVARESFCRLVAAVEVVQAYLSVLAKVAPARPVVGPRTPEGIAARDPRRHFHILEDDEHYAVRVNCRPVSRDPWVVALFGPAPASMGARA